MTHKLSFVDATNLAVNVMINRQVYAELRHQNGSWRVIAGGNPSGETPWVNLWRSLHKAIAEKNDDPGRVFWLQLGRLVEAKNRLALVAHREIHAMDIQSSQVKDSFFHKSSVLELKEYSKGVDDASVMGS